MRQSPRSEERRAPRLTRPRKWVVGLGTIVLIVGLANLARGGLAIAYAVGLPELPMTVSWAYLAATGIFWGLVLVACSIYLAAFCRWARWTTLVGTSLYEIHAWVNHLAFDANDYARRTWPRDLLLTVVFLALVWAVLSWPSIRNEFER